MPLYDYICGSCHPSEELYVSSSDDRDRQICSKCGNLLSRQISSAFFHSGSKGGSKQPHINAAPQSERQSVQLSCGTIFAQDVGTVFKGECAGIEIDHLVTKNVGNVFDVGDTPVTVRKYESLE